MQQTFTEPDIDLQLPTMLAQQLITLDQVELSHLHAGDSTPLATGTLSLALVTVPVQQQPMPGAFSQEKEKLSAPPPIPPRPSSPSRSPSPAGTTDEWLLLTMTAGGDEEPLFEMPVPSSSR